MKFASLGAASAVTGAPALPFAEAVAPAASSGGTVPLTPAMFLKARTQLLKFIFDAGRSGRELSAPYQLTDAKRLDPWATSSFVKMDEAQDRGNPPASFDPDLLLDWSRHSTEGRALSTDVQEYIRLVEEAEDARRYVDLRWKHRELFDRIGAEFLRSRWASSGWINIFAERFAEAEWNVYASGKFALSLDEFSVLAASLIQGSCLIEPLAFGHPLARLYTDALARDVIAALRPFVPHHARELERLYLSGTPPRLGIDVNKLTHYDFDLERSVYKVRLSAANMNALFAGDPKISTWYDYFNGEYPNPGYFEDLDRFARALPAAYEQFLEIQHQLLANLAKNPVTIVGMALEREIRARIREVEFELATLPARLNACRHLAERRRCAFHSSQMQSYAQVLARLPGTHSRDWLRWKPYRWKAKTAVGRGKIVRPRKTTPSFDVAWLRTLLAPRISLSADMIEWMAAASAEKTTAISKAAASGPSDSSAPPTSPDALEYKPVLDPLCDHSLDEIHEIERAEKDGDATSV